jgi:hypothetical protein
MSETVFIVEGAPDHEPYDRMVIFRTRERAEEFIKQQPKFNCYDWFIYECENTGLNYYYRIMRLT